MTICDKLSAFNGPFLKVSSKCHLLNSLICFVCVNFSHWK